MFNWLPDELFGLIVAHADIAALNTFAQLYRRSARLVKARLERCAAPLTALPGRPLGSRRSLFMCERLQMASKGIGDPMVELLCTATSAGALPLLKDLNLAYNLICDAGMVALAETMRHGALSRLLHLHLTGNRIDDTGISSLASAAHSPLQARGVSSTTEGPQPGQRPVWAMSNLRSLYLGNNQLGDGGVIALADAFVHHGLPSLRTLTLQDNFNIGDVGARCLRTALVRREPSGLPKLWLNLSGNMISGPLMTDGWMPVIGDAVLL